MMTEGGWRRGVIDLVIGMEDIEVAIEVERSEAVDVAGVYRREPANERAEEADDEGTSQR